MDRSADRIQPWPDNSRYWQYRGEPVVLLGATDADNAFQMPDLDEQMRRLTEAGGNVIRNTMSDRPDHGYEVYPYVRRNDGRYDLNAWNPEYWRRFAHMLELTERLGVIVQIEMWDRFDLTDAKGNDYWQRHPYRPANNVNYTEAESGLADRYPDHPGANRQPFYFTTPAQRANTCVLRWQNRYVAKVLEHSLRHYHVLYCIDNETKADAEWAMYWRDFIAARAREAGRGVCITEMWDDWILQAARHRRTFDRPEKYAFADVSQNNQRKGHEHWTNLQWARVYLGKQPRPMNMTKIYGADTGPHGSTRDGLERFWRSVLGGVASARFHRPPSGQGINDLALASIRSVRLIESRIRLWELEPADELLRRSDPNDAYAAAKPGTAYVLYFTGERSAALDLRGEQGPWRADWIDIARGAWADASDTSAGDWCELTPPAAGHWAAVVGRS